MNTRVKLVPPPFTCRRYDERSGSVCVRLEGELDLATAPQLADALRAAQRDGRPVVLDLRDLVFMDCAGMHVVLDASRRARLAGRRMIVVRGGRQVDLVFSATQSSPLLEMVDLDPAEPAAAAAR